MDTIDIPQPRPAISVSRLFKRFGSVTAVAGVSFDVWPGTVVALVGPSGSGKSTVIRSVLGADEPTSGTAGFVARDARDTRDAPAVVVLDEPLRGLELDRAGRLCNSLRDFAHAGNAVLLATRFADDIAQTADVCIVLDSGRVVANASVDELLAGAARAASTRVRTRESGRFAAVLAARGHACFHIGFDALRVHDITPDALGRLARDARVDVSEIVFEPPALETVVAGFLAGNPAR